MLRDIKHALRMFVQSPAFALAAVAALTLGIAVNTAIFSVVNAVLLRPLPFPERRSHRVFHEHRAATVRVSRRVAGEVRALSAADAKSPNWRRRSTASSSTTPTAVFPSSCAAAACRADFFRLFGAQTMMGRTFSAEEDRPRGDKVALISKALLARPAARAIRRSSGKAISLGGVPHTVIGVLDDFEFGDVFNQPVQVWVPFQLDPNTSDHGHYFQSAARLKEGIVARTGAGAAAEPRPPTFSAKFQGRARAAGRVQRRADRRSARAQRAAVAVRARSAPSVSCC